MKKSSIAVAVLLIITVLAGCASKASENRQGQNAKELVLDIPKDTEGMEVTKTVDEQNDALVSALRFIEPGVGTGNQNGFYYLAGESGEETDAAGNPYINIRYIDYQSRQDIFLCNRPNCNHDDENCTSYIQTGWQRSAILLAGEEQLYLICNPYGSVTFSADGDMSQEQNIPTVYTMNLDGSNRKKIVELESGCELQSTQYLENGDKLYLVLSKSELKADGNNTTAVRTGQELVEVDTQKKSVRTVRDFLYQDIIGVWNQCAVIRQCHYDKNPDEMTDSEYMAAFDQLPVTIATLDLESGETSTLFETDYRSTDELTMDRDNIYFGKAKSGTLNRYDIQTKETTVVTNELPDGYIGSVIDGRIICNCDNGAALNAEFTDSFSLDVETGEITKRNLDIEKPHSPVEILADAGEYYLVTSDYIYEEEISWAGTEQINIKKFIRSLILKEDFWQSKANFLAITEQGGAQ